MAFWPVRAGNTLEVSIARSSSDWTSTQLTGGVANTKGSYSTLVAATTADSYLAVVRLGDTQGSATATSALVDIAIGAAASELVIMPNLACGYRAPFGVGTGSAAIYYIPLYIPAGSRVSARCQGVQASKGVKVCVDLYGGSALEGERMFPVFSKMVDYGTDLANSKGVSLAITANTWAQVVASTSNPVNALLWGLQADAGTILTQAGRTIDLGVGAAASEVAVQTGIEMWTSTGEEMRSDVVMPLMALNIPAGSRLAARPSVNLATDIILYGLVR